MKSYFSDPPELEEDYVLDHSAYMYFTDKDANFLNLTNTQDSPEVLAKKVAVWIAEDRGTVQWAREKVWQFFH